MEKIGIIFGSDAGTTQDVVTRLKEHLNADADLIDVANAKVEQINEYSNLVFATSTWGSGDLQGDWESFESHLNKIDFNNKTVALLGLGDQEGYDDTFCDGIGLIYEYLDAAKVIGKTSTQGYNFEESKAVVDGEFVGLVIDEDNQDDLTDERLENWANVLNEGFN